MLGAVLLLAACSDTVTTEPSPGASGETLPAPDSAPMATDGGDATTSEPGVSPDTAPATDAATGSEAPSGASTTVAETSSSAPPDTGSAGTTATAPTDGVAVVYAAGGGSELAWTPIGWWDGTAWREEFYDPDTFEWLGPPEPTVDGLAATSLDLPDGDDQVITGLTAGPLDFYCVGDEQGPVFALGVDVPETAVTNGYDVVAVTADWPLQPRPVRQVGLDVPVYANTGTALMAAETPTAAEGEVVQVVRADLDGDGTEEVLVAYERQTSDGFGVAGDFSAIYARYPSTDGSVVDELVFRYVSEDPVDFPTPGRATIAAIADLNGDGVMEVVVRSTFWESAGADVYALQDGRLERVAGNGCGV